MRIFLAACCILAAGLVWSQEPEPAPKPENEKPDPTEKAEKGEKTPPGADGAKPERSGGIKPSAKEVEKAGTASAARPDPKFKTPQASDKFLEAKKKMESREYTGARVLLSVVQKDATTPADRKLVQSFIDDTKLGDEIEGSRKMVERKDERKAIARVEKALKTYTESTLRPEAEKFIQETEEIIYLIFDDFEPGSSLQKETEGRKAEETSTKEELTKSSGRWKKNMSYNSDPRMVRHGKGSMKWRVGGDYFYSSSYSYWWATYGYVTAPLKNPITKWRQLVFSVYLPEADEGALRVTLATDEERGVFYSLYSKNLIDLRKQKGWKEVRLDLNRDFGNTQNVKLEDVRYIRIEYMQNKQRTIYLDFIHLE